MSNAGEIKIINKLLEDLTQYSSVKLFEDALDEVMDSYGSRDEMYKVLGLDKDAIQNWENKIGNCYHILTGLQMVAETGAEQVEDEILNVASVSTPSTSAKALKPGFETPDEKKKRLEQEFFDVFGV